MITQIDSVQTILHVMKDFQTEQSSIGVHGTGFPRQII